MPFFEWSDALSVGFDEIDTDHKKLVDMINKLDDAVSTGQELAVIGGILDELISYTSWHFRHEERLMQTYGYPGLLDHKRKHDDLTEQALAMQKDFQDGDANVPANLPPFLKTWLTDHILGTDRKTAQFLAELME